MRDEFGAPTGKFRQTETFDTERKAKAHLRKVEDQLEARSGIDPSAPRPRPHTPLGDYAKQYLDSPGRQSTRHTIEGYAKMYRTHIAPVFGSKPVAAITTADVTAFRRSCWHRTSGGRSSRAASRTRSAKTTTGRL